jgi:predicted nuclease with TOPRIM domain
VKKVTQEKNQAIEEKAMLQTLYEAAQSDFKKVKQEISNLQAESNIHQSNIQEKTFKGMIMLPTGTEKQENEKLVQINKALVQKLKHLNNTIDGKSYSKEELTNPFREESRTQEEITDEKPYTVGEFNEFVSCFKNLDSYWPKEEKMFSSIK